MKRKRISLILLVSSPLALVVFLALEISGDSLELLPQRALVKVCLSMQLFDKPSGYIYPND